jgi:diacylglycerol kinase (ATP)
MSAEISKTMILVNPRAREGEVGEKWPELERQLLGALGKGEAQVEFTSATDHGEAAVRRRLKEGVGRIVVVGGDGTVSEAIQGFFEKGKLLSSNTVLAVMPAGRGDDFFKVLAGRRCKSSAEAWSQGLELLKFGKPEPMDLGRITWLPQTVGGAAVGHDRAFINLASFGFPGLVVQRVVQRKGILGRSPMGRSGWAYAAQIVTGLAEYKPIRTEVRVDGEIVFDGPLFSGFVLNGYYNAGGMRWSHEARIDDGLLHVVLTEPRGPLSTVLSGPRMLSGDWRNVKGVHRFKGTKIEIRAIEKAERGFPLFEIDGEQPESVGTLGAVIEVVPNAIRVLK